jgi:hypothetical protein
MSARGPIEVWCKETQEGLEWALLTTQCRNGLFDSSYQLLKGGTFPLGPFTTQEEARKAAQDALTNLGYSSAAHRNW